MLLQYIHIIYVSNVNNLILEGNLLTFFLLIIINYHINLNKRLKSCEMLLEEEKENNEFKKEELVCANCTDIPIESCNLVN
jgi:hypothetical protein